MPARKLPQRKRPPHHPLIENGNRARIVFLTLCTKHRRRILDCELANKALIKASKDANQWTIGRYVLMPDHLHLFCAPSVWPPETLAGWVGYFKRLFTAEIRQEIEDFQWQRDFWDTQLRRGDSYSEKRSYVINNPVRAGLVQQAEDWPYSGELNQLSWHD
jgi:REP element-mobilizing transposase RayT